jgi:hypothetical protein
MKLRYVGVLIALLCCAHAAQAAADDRITVLYVNGIATSAAQADDDRAALSRTIEGSALRGIYPQAIDVRNAYNPSNGNDADVAELVALKSNEERYLGTLWQAFLEGADAPAVLEADALDTVVNDFLSQDPATIRSVIAAISAEWAPLLAADPQRKLVLVGHSQGNFIVNGALLDLATVLGSATALSQVRVVNVGSAAAWSPFGLDVTLAQDTGVIDFLPDQGRRTPRDTPFCRSAGTGEGCPFFTGIPTLQALGVCATPLSSSTERAGGACHNFRATYLSALPTAIVPTQRLAAAAFTREGAAAADRLVDAIFTAIDSMDGALPAGWQNLADGGFFGQQATSPKPRAIDLRTSASAPAADALSKTSFDQGAKVQWQACLRAGDAAAGEALVLLDLSGRDSSLAANAADQGDPLWAAGFRIGGDDAGTLEVLFGTADLPRRPDGVERFAARPPISGQGLCGRFGLAVEADGHGVARFQSRADGQTYSWRSTRPVTPGVYRLHLSAREGGSVAVRNLAVQPISFEPPFAP